MDGHRAASVPAHILVQLQFFIEVGPVWAATKQQSHSGSQDVQEPHVYLELAKETDAGSPLKVPRS